MVDVANRNKRQPVALITGAAAGFGKACARHLSSRGYRVYGASRSARFDAEAASGEHQPFTTIPMDVCDASSVKAGITCLLDQEEKLMKINQSRL